MEYCCEDLSRYGVILLPPSSPEYAAALDDIQRRLANPLPGSPPQLPDVEDPAAPTMIVYNRSQIAIAAMSWIWRFEPETGRSTGSSVMTAGTPLLKPFGLDAGLRKLYGYWHVILPGSRRGIRGNSMFGDNTDARPPEPGELWTGGSFGLGAGSGHPLGPLKSVTLVLDGVFFIDGGFAGPILSELLFGSQPMSKYTLRWQESRERATTRGFPRQRSSRESKPSQVQIAGLRRPL